MPRRDNLQKSSDSSAISTTKTEAIHDTSSRSVLSIEDSGIIKYLAVSYSILTLDCPFCWTPIPLPELSWQPELWTEGPPPRTDQNVQRSHRMLLWWSSELRTFQDNKLLKAAMEYRTALDTWLKCKMMQSRGVYWSASGPPSKETLSERILHERLWSMRDTWIDLELLGSPVDKWVVMFDHIEGQGYCCQWCKCQHATKE